MKTKLHNFFKSTISNIKFWLFPKTIHTNFEVNYDKEKWRGIATFKAPLSKAQRVLPKIGSECSVLDGWRFLTVESAKIDNVYDNLCTITVEYSGTVVPKLIASIDN